MTIRYCTRTNKMMMGCPRFLFHSMFEPIDSVNKIDAIIYNACCVEYEHEHECEFEYDYMHTVPMMMSK